MTKRFTSLALTLALAAGLSACSSFEGGSTDKAEQSSDKRVRVAMLQPPRSGLNPLSDDAFKLMRWRATETLVLLDAEGNTKPLLATEWKQTTPTTWQFTIRKGVVFHDGTAMTAQHVADSLTHASKASPLPRILDGVQMSVKADGDNVIVTTGEADPLLPHRMSSPQLAILAPSAYKGKTVTPLGTATGPFRITRINGTVGATLERNDSYWGDKATAAGIDATYVPDGTARVAALRTREADIVEAVPAGQAATVDGKLLHEVPMPRTNTLYLNTRKGAFADPAVRATAREALATKTIVDKVYEGRADVAAGLLGPAVPWAAAQREAADYAKVLEGRAKANSGSGRKITIGTFTDRAELPEVAVQVQSMLKAKGFEVTLDVREYQYIEADALAGKFDAFILSRATVLDSGDPVAYLTSDFTCKGSFNIAQLCNPAVDAAVKKAAAAPAGDERRKAIAAAEATILATDAAVPMLHERVIQGEQTTVSDAARDPRERELVTARTKVS